MDKSTALIINYIINSGGMIICLLFTIAHGTLAVISSYDDYNLLEAMDKVKVCLVACHKLHIS